MTETYELFAYESCGFCAMVRAFLAQAGLDIPVRDILKDVQARRELLEGGGRTTVPCLRIESGGEVQWMYESMDIIAYLNEKMNSQ